MLVALKSRFSLLLLTLVILGTKTSGHAGPLLWTSVMLEDDAELRLRANPRVAFAPASILFIGEIRGGADDNEDLYCASIEWDWDDDTTSATTPDCEPYEPGVSEIRRRFSVRHNFDYGGRYQVRLHLKQDDDTIMSARTRVEVRGYRLR